jgi:hypothetical protein
LLLKWSSYISGSQARGKVVLNAREDLPDDTVASGVLTEIARIRSIPLPVTLDLTLTFHWSSFGAKIEHPARDQSTEDWNIGHNDSDVVLDVVNAKVDRVGPVGLVKKV